MKTVVVVFTDRSGQTYGRSTSAQYHYVVDDAVAVKTGDHAVAHNGKEFAIVKVVDVTAGASSKANKTLVTILDDESMAKYSETNKALKQQRELFARLDVLLAQESEKDKYRRLAEYNSEAADIIKSLGLAK